MITKTKKMMPRIDKKVTNATDKVSENIEIEGKI